jgi:chromosome segregation ATPase
MAESNKTGDGAKQEQVVSRVGFGLLPAKAKKNPDQHLFLPPSSSTPAAPNKKSKESPSTNSDDRHTPLPSINSSDHNKNVVESEDIFQDFRTKSKMATNAHPPQHSNGSTNSGGGGAAPPSSKNSKTLAAYIESRHTFFNQGISYVSDDASTATAATAVLSERLAETQEKYQTELRQLRQERTLWRVDRKELDRLRHQIDLLTTKQAGNNNSNNIAGTNTNTSSQNHGDSKQSIHVEFQSLQKTYQELVQDHAEQEDQLEEAANQMQELKRTLQELQYEFKDLKVELNKARNDAVWKGGSTAAPPSAAPTTDTSPSTTDPREAATIADLEEQVLKWQTVYFDTMELGNSKLETFERELEQLQQQREDEAHVAVEQLEKLQAQFQAQLDHRQLEVRQLEKESSDMRQQQGEELAVLQDELQRANEKIVSLEERTKNVPVELPVETLKSVGNADEDYRQKFQAKDNELQALESKWKQEKARSSFRERDLQTQVKKEQELASARSKELSKLRSQYETAMKDRGSGQAALKKKVQALESQLAQTNLQSQEAQGDLATQEQLVTSLESQLKSFQELSSGQTSTHALLEGKIQTLQAQLQKANSQSEKDRTAVESAESKRRDLDTDVESRMREAEANWNRKHQEQQQALEKEHTDLQSKLKDALALSETKDGELAKLKESSAKQLKDQALQVQSAEARATVLEKLLLESAKNKSELKDQAQSLQKQLEETKEESAASAARQLLSIPNSKDELEASQKELSEAKERLEEMSKSMSKLEEEKTELVASAAASQSGPKSAEETLQEVQNKLKAVESTSSEKEEQWAQERHELKTKANRATALEKQLMEATSSTSEFEDTIQSLQKQLEESKESPDNASRQLRSLPSTSTDELDATKKELAESKGKIEESAASLSKSESRWEEEKSELQGSAVASRSLQAVATSSNELAEANAALQEAQSKLQTLEKVSSENEQEWTKERAELKGKAEKAMLKLGETTIVSRRLEESRREVETTSIKIKNLEAAFADERNTWDKERDEMRAESQKQSASSLSTSELDEARSTLEETTSKLQNLEKSSLESQSRWEEERTELQGALEKARLDLESTAKQASEIEEAKKGRDEATAKLKELEKSLLEERNAWEKDRIELVASMGEIPSQLLLASTSDALKDEIETSKKALVEATTQLQELEKSSSDDKEVREQEKADWKASKAEFETQLGSTAVLTNDLEEANASLVEAKSQLEQLETKLSTSQDAWEKERTELQAATDKASGEIKKELLKTKIANDLVSTLREQLLEKDSVEKQLSGAKEGVDSLTLELRSTKDTLEAAEARSTQIEDELRVAQSKIEEATSLQAKVDKLTQESLDARQDLQAREDEYRKISEQESAMAALETENKATQARKDEEIDRLKYDLLAKEREREELQKTAVAQNELQDSLAEKEKALQDAFAEKEKAEEECNALRDSQADLQKQLDEQKKKTEVTISVLDTLKKQRDEETKSKRGLFEKVKSERKLANVGMAKASSELDELKAVHKKSIDQMEEKIGSLRASLEESAEKVSALESNNYELSKERDALLEGKSELLKKLETPEADAKENTVMKQTIDDLNSQFTEQVQNIEEADKESAAGKKQLDAAKADLDDVSTKLDETVSKLCNTQNELDDLQAANAELQATIEKQASESNENSKEETAKLEGLFSDALTSLKEKDAKIDEFTAKLFTTENELEELQAAKAELQETIEKQASETNEKSKEETAKLEGLLSDALTSLKEKDAKIDETASKLSTTENELEELQAQKAELQETIEKKDSEIDEKAKEATTKLEGLLSDALSSLKEKDAKIDETASNLSATQKELEELQAAKAVLHETIDKQTSDIDEKSKEEAAKLEGLLSDALSSLKEKDAKIDETASKLSATQKELEELQAQKAELQETMDKQTSETDEDSKGETAKLERLLSDALSSLKEKDNEISKLQKRPNEKEHVQVAKSIENNDDLLTDSLQLLKERNQEIERLKQDIESTTKASRDLDTEEKKVSSKILAAQEKQKQIQMIEQLEASLEKEMAQKEELLQRADSNRRLEELQSEMERMQREEQASSKLGKQQLGIIEKLEGQILELMNKESASSLAQQAPSESDDGTAAAEKEEMLQRAESHVAELQREAERMQREEQVSSQLGKEQFRIIEQLETQIEELMNKESAAQAESDGTAANLVAAQSLLKAHKSQNESLVNEVADQKTQMDVLQTELAQFQEAARKNTLAAEAEMEKLGEVAFLELDKLGATVKALQSQKDNQINVITSLEKRLTEVTSKSLQKQAQLKDLLAREKAKVDAMTVPEGGQGPPPTLVTSRPRNSSARPSRSRFSQFLSGNFSIPEGGPEVIAEEQSEIDDSEDDVSTLGSLTSGVSQKEFIGAAKRKKRESNPWSRFSALVMDIENTEADEEAEDVHLNDLFRKREDAKTKERVIVPTRNQSDLDDYASNTHEELNELWKEEAAAAAAATKQSSSKSFRPSIIVPSRLSEGSELTNNDFGVGAGDASEELDDDLNSLFREQRQAVIVDFQASDLDALSPKKNKK